MCINRYNLTRMEAVICDECHKMGDFDNGIQFSSSMFVWCRLEGSVTRVSVAKDDSWIATFQFPKTRMGNFQRFG